MVLLCRTPGTPGDFLAVRRAVRTPVLSKGGSCLVEDVLDDIYLSPSFGLAACCLLRSRCCKIPKRLRVHTHITTRLCERQIKQKTGGIHPESKHKVEPAALVLPPLTVAPPPWSACPGAGAAYCALNEGYGVYAANVLSTSNPKLTVFAM